MDITDHLDFYRDLESGHSISSRSSGESKGTESDDKLDDLPEEGEFDGTPSLPNRGAKPSSTPTLSPYPKELSQQDTVNMLIPNITKENMELNLAAFSSFHTRYYKSEFGLNASLWLADKILEIANLGNEPSPLGEDVDNGKYRTKRSQPITVKTFPHAWGQKSVIATIPGKSSVALSGIPSNEDEGLDAQMRDFYNAKGNVIVISAHLDSTNLLFPTIMPAPGADDNGSGTVTILEVFRILVESGFEPENTIQFHWYSAEEGGLLGSQAVLTEYKRRGVAIKALLQQDMTGYIGRGVENDSDSSFGLMTDYVDKHLTDLMKLIISTYAEIGYTEDKCGYGCSDHASATKVGYPSAFVMEAPMKKSNPFIHSVMDTIDRLSFEHMAQHARLTLGYAVELGLFKFDQK